MKEPIQVGVIGLGRMGQRHCRVFSGMRNARLAGVCDVSASQGEQVARQYQVPFYASVDDLLAQVEAVSLVTPTPAHFELALRCLERGVHVLIEKPITETVGQALQLAQAAEQSGLVVQIGHIERFNPAYQELKHVLEGTAMLALHIQRLSPHDSSNVDVDVILDLMIHDLDLIVDLMGRPPEAVEAFGLETYGGGVDHAVAHLTYTAGPLIMLTASRVTEQKVRSIEVTAQDAYLRCDLLNKSIEVHRRTFGEYLSYNHHGVKYRHEAVVERIHVPTFEPLLLELQQFVDSVAGVGPRLVSAADGLRALQLAEAVRHALSRHLVRPAPAGPVAAVVALEAG
jgi:predicted dehydrogenase